MKHLLALIAITVVLGAACKKSDGVTDSKPSIKLNLKATVPQDGIGGYPGGANTYPHNTGVCYCGDYPNCHPTKTSYPAGADGPISTWPPK